MLLGLANIAMSDGKAAHHVGVPRGAHQVIAQLHDVPPVVTVVLRELIEPVAQPTEHLELALAHQVADLVDASLYAVRAIYDHLQGRCALVLPCRVLDTQGTGIGQGILTGSTTTALGRQLYFSTTMPLTSGSPLSLQFVMPEYHEPLLLTTTVASCAMTGPQGVCSYTQAVLTVTGGEAASAFLTPGSCLAATRAWRPARS